MLATCVVGARPDPAVLGADGAGVILWSADQAAWVYARWCATCFPDPWVMDIFLFLHLVPMIAAVGLRPHRPKANKVFPKHPGLSDAAGLVGVSLRLRCVSRRICVLNVVGTTEIRLSLPGGERRSAGGARGRSQRRAPGGRWLPEPVGGQRSTPLVPWRVNLASQAGDITPEVSTIFRLIASVAG